MRVSRREFLKAGGVLVVGAGLVDLASSSAGAQTLPNADRFLGKPLAADQVDSFLAIHADGSLTVFSGKVDMGTGGRIAMRQIVAEELDVQPDRIAMIEGDTALTPDQGSTAGSYGIARGGMQLRQAAATARRALLALAAPRLGRGLDDLEVADGVVRTKDGRASVSYAELIGDRALGVAVDPKAPVKDPQRFRFIGKSLARPDVPAKVTGRHKYLHDLTLPGMLHARVLRPPALGATLRSVDESSIKTISGARVVRVESFVGVVAEREWDAVRASGLLRAEWTGGTPLTDHATLFGVADVRADRATIWTSSQGTHRYRAAFARVLTLPAERVRVIYLDGAGSYGQNGAEDAACDAALLSRAVGRPVRVQWSRQDEHGWDPKGPPQLLQLRAAVDERGEVAAWETRAWLPVSTANLPNLPFLAADAARIAQPQGRAIGLIYQNIDPPYQYPNVDAAVRWIPDAPLRTSPIRAPGKIANSFAVESFVDEIAALAGIDPVAFRLRHLGNPRGAEVLRRAAARMGWQARPSPRTAAPKAPVATGRGIAYVHYKHDETLVAIGMEVEVERASGRIRVTRIVCAHDCGLMINPGCVQAQVEGNILQTLSRALHEEIVYDRDRVTTVDWQSYPILTFPEVPAVEVELLQRLDAPPLGAGEAASAPVAAALSNAVFDATGVRLRTVPFRPERVRAALAGRPS